MTPAERKAYLLAPIALPTVWGRQSWSGCSTRIRLEHHFTARKRGAYTGEDN